jgi:hypothetical protein
MSCIILIAREWRVEEGNDIWPKMMFVCSLGNIHTGGLAVWETYVNLSRKKMISFAEINIYVTLCLKY